jgi:DNA repair and recombination protein RAD52
MVFCGILLPLTVGKPALVLVAVQGAPHNRELRLSSDKLHHVTRRVRLFETQRLNALNRRDSVNHINHGSRIFSSTTGVSILHDMFSEPRTPGTIFEDSFPEMKPPVFDMGISVAPEASIIQAKLNRRLGPEYVSQRPAPGGGPKLTYVEGWKIIGLANEVFGYNGWCSTVTKIETDFIDMDPESRRYSIGVTALVRITLKDGTYHEDIGYGTGDNLKSKGVALDKVRRATPLG